MYPEMRFVILSVAALYLASTLTVADELLVTLPNGKVQGRKFKSPANKTIYAFQGIPYASPPTGLLRFQAPVPAKNWDGILDATKEGSDCVGTFPPLPPYSASQSEDCLFINVYTPKLSTNSSKTKLLPVMFWIYGGGYFAGSASNVSYGPDYLVQEDVVFVSFNYRLGSFGFLSTGDEVIPGNAGLKDQTFALKWTYENIHLFGGDKEKITIFGESSGSVSVTYHIMSNQSAGLFRAAIAESGTALNYWIVNTDPLSYAVDLVSKIAEDNNITIDNATLTPKGILHFLTNQASENIKTADLQLFKEQVRTLPVVEHPHENAFISQANYDMLKKGKINRVPVIVGFNSEEYLWYIQSIANLTVTAQSYDKNIEKLIPYTLILDDSTNKTEVAAEIKQNYVGCDGSFSSNLGAFVRYQSDSLFVYTNIKDAKLLSKFTDVYFYQFSYDGPLGRINNISVEGTLGEVGHAEELLYLFKSTAGLGRNTSDLSIYPKEDLLTLTRMVKMWTNFAKFLNPTPDLPETSEILQHISWPTLKQGCFQYLNISENLEIVNGYPRGRTFQQWDKIHNNWGVRPY